MRSGRLMVKQLTLPLFLSVLLTAQVFADSKRAFKLLEKGDYDKLEEYLDKSIEKDTINAGAKYVYSLLYLTPEYRNYDIDKAYAYINDAQSDFVMMEEKDLERLEKIGIDESAIEHQKEEVEFHAYRRASSLHTIDDYNFFIDQFQGAAQVDSAIALRNRIAFEQAEEENTYEAFYAFMHTYPEAEEVEAAKKKYEALLYYSRTGEQRLDSFERFVKNNPNSPFRDQAEKNIFEIYSADNRPESYLSFLENYPSSKQRKRALNFLYHTFKHQASAERFLNRFNFLSSEDSLMRVVQADIGYLIPIYEMGKYGFILEDGRKLIDFIYTDINDAYLCGDIQDDFLEVWLDTEHMLVSRLGAIIYQNSFESVEELGVGLLRIEHMNRFGVLHKSGTTILDINYEDIGLVADAFIKYKFNGRWGLITLTGRELLPPDYEEIFSEGGFILLRRGDLYAIQNVDNISAITNLEQPDIQMIYDDFELINEHHMLVFSGDKEAIIDIDLEEKIPLDQQQVFELYNGWYVRKNGKIKLYDQIFIQETAQVFDKIIHSGPRAALKKGNKWAIYSQGKDIPTQFDYDSVQFLSERIGIIEEGDKTYAIFENDSLIDISYSAETKLLMDRSLVIDEAIRTGQYLSTKSARGDYTVYNVFGTVILDGRYSTVEAMGNEYLVISRSGKYGLVHNSGEVALKLRYKAIGNYNDGYVSTLINGKFGIYNYTKNIFLSAKYEKHLKPFGDQYFIGTKGNKLGFIDRENEDISGFRFDEVLYWNDSSALVRIEDEWNIYDIQGDNDAYQPISEFKYLRNEKENILIIITCKSGNGVLSNREGQIITPTFNDVVNVGSVAKPVYFAEKYIREAEFYVIIYYDASGNILRKQVFNQEEYDNIYCG